MEDCQQAIIVADVIRAAGTEAARISEVSAKLGIERRRTGCTPKELSAEDTIRVLAVRRLQEVGVALGAAVKAVSFETLKEIILTDEQRWIAVAPDGAVSVCSVDGLAELAVSRSGIKNLRIVNLRTAIRDIFSAQLERTRFWRDRPRLAVRCNQRRRMSQRGAVKHRRAPSGTPAGVYIGLDEAQQVTVLLSHDWGEAMEVALSKRQAASVDWHLLALAEPASISAFSAPKFER